MLASALAGFDRARLPFWERLARLAVAGELVAASPVMWAIGVAAFVALIARQFMVERASASQS